jgi:class 3 adenylate cyclase/sugar lactone lactonase YvrE
VEQHLKVVNPGPEQPSSELLTFLFADVRGYTRFTQEHGDEAAAALASRFADIVEGTVTAFGGRLLELRGDEALVVFSSVRQAVRAGVAIQDRCLEAMEDDPSLHLKVGIGIDAGEGVAVKGGYRSGALNLAARLCSQAGPGQVLVTQGVMHLARKIDGLAFVEGKRVQVKGIDQPVQLIAVVHETARAAPQQARSTIVAVLGGAVAALLLLIIAALIYELWPRGATRTVATLRTQSATFWGTLRAPKPHLNFPDALTVGPDGSLYVADAYNYRIVRLAADGTFLQAYGGQGTGEGQFSRPVGLAIGSTGRLYVADSEGHCIEEITASGIPLLSCGNQVAGSAPGEFNQPSAVATDGSGTLYVGDSSNAGIQVHSALGWRQWSLPTTVAGLALDRHGHLFASDGASTIWELAVKDGRVIGKWGSAGTDNSQLSGASAIAVDPQSGRVYVASVNDNHIKVFTAYGAWLASWPAPTAVGTTAQPNALALDGRGHLFVAYGGADRVVRFSLSGKPDPSWGPKPGHPVAWGVTNNLAADAAGNVFVADSERGRIDEVSADGRPAGSISGLTAPQSVAVDQSGDVYTADTGANRVKEFYPDGHLAAELDNGSPQSFGLGRFQTPYAVGVDRAGDVFVASSNNNDYIEELPARWRRSRRWQQFDRLTPLSCSAAPACLAVDPNAGTVYGVTGHSVVRFSPAGPTPAQVDGRWKLMSGVGSGASPVDLASPSGITVDGLGHLYVVDGGLHRILEFSRQGVLLGETKDLGRTVSTVNGIAVDARGSIYLSLGTGRPSPVIKLASLGPVHH